MPTSQLSRDGRFLGGHILFAETCEGVSWLIIPTAEGWESTAELHLVQNRADKNVRPQQPLLVEPVSLWILRKGEPQGSGDGGTGIVSLLESLCQVRQQAVSHPQGCSGCFSHRISEVQLL